MKRSKCELDFINRAFTLSFSRFSQHCAFVLKVTNFHIFFEEICSSFTTMAVVRTHFENNNEVGVFSKLTNAYCLIGIGRSANFFATFESELDEVIPVIYSTIGGKIMNNEIEIF